jgi:hypothetical protein
VADSVKAHPGMYFGAYPASDWGLVIAAWTAADLLRLAVDAPSVEVRLRADGGLTAMVRGARVTAPVEHPARSAREIIRGGMWYTELAKSTVVDAGAEREPEHEGAEYVWHGLDVTVHSELDGDLFGLPGGGWWRDGITRLAAVLATPRHRPPDGQRVHVVDEATGASAFLP